MTNKNFFKLPPIIRQIMIDGQAWMCGSGANWILNDGKRWPKDFDIIVPPENWLVVSRMLKVWGDSGRAKMFLNTFGGLKWTLGPWTFDVWPDHLETFLTKTPKLKSHVLIRWNPRCVIREVI